jgi:tetratricopeptide (TPR) repeat protein
VILSQQPAEDAESIREVFERAGDAYGLALYWCSVAVVAWGRVQVAETENACERALSHLERAGILRGYVPDIVRFRLASTYSFGPTHVDEAIERVHEIIEAGSGQVALAYQRSVLGRLHAMRGEFDVAREFVAGARQAYLDSGMLVVAGALSMAEGWIEWRAGDVAAAERVLREGVELLERIGDRFYRGTVALNLADLYYNIGRFDEARELCASARETTEPSDLINFVMLDAIEGSLLAREGRFEEAIEQCRRGVERTKGSDGLENLAIPRRYLAEVLFLAGRTTGAAQVGAEALEIRDAKGDATGAARTRELFARLGLELDDR